MFSGIIIAATVFISNISTGFVYSPFTLPDNGIAVGNVATDDTCRVVLVGTNIVKVSEFLGLTNWPSETAAWFAEMDRRSNQVVSTSTATDAQNVHNARTNDLQAARSWDLGPGLGSGSFMNPDHVSIPPRYTLGQARIINFNPASNAKVSQVIDWLRFIILAAAGYVVVWEIIHDWDSVVGKMSGVIGTRGMGISVFGNAAPAVAAQINAVAGTLFVTSGCIGITAVVGVMVGVYASQWLSGLPVNNVWQQAALYLFNLCIPVTGLVTIAAVYLGWIITKVIMYYLNAVYRRHLTA